MLFFVIAHKKNKKKPGSDNAVPRLSVNGSITRTDADFLETTREVDVKHEGAKLILLFQINRYISTHYSKNKNAWLHLDAVIFENVIVVVRDPTQGIFRRHRFFILFFFRFFYV